MPRSRPLVAPSLPFIAVLSVALISGVLGGCGDPLFQSYDDAALLDGADRLLDIRPIDLRDRAIEPVLTIEDVAAATEGMLGLPPEPPATGTVGLTIEDVRAAALENNLDLQVELFRPTLARLDLQAEQAKFEAVLTGSVRWDSIDSPVVLATEGSQTDITSTDVGLRVPLRTGGQINVSVPVRRQETNNMFSVVNPSYDTDVRFSISQPLFRNAGVRTNTHSIRVAQYETSISSARTKLEAMRVLANADRAYWLVYAAEQELEVAELQYQLASEQLQQARRKVEAGDTPPIEITRAESGVASRIEAIILARTTRDQRERDLRRIVNRPDLPLGGDFRIELESEPEPVRLILPPDELVDFAIAHRMEMLELELQLAIDASTVDLQRNQRLPLVTLDYVYNFNGLDSRLGDSLDSLTSFDFVDWSLGLSAEIPLGNEAREAQYRRAILARLQRLATRDQRQQSIEVEVRDTVEQLEQNWRRILAARQATILASRTYDAEQRQFQVGLRTSTDVLDAAASLADAQTREIAALVDYQISQVDVAFATGTVLGHGLVTWAPVDAPPLPDGPQTQ